MTTPSPGGVLQGLLKAAFGLTILVIVLFAMFLAWWIALLAAGTWLLYAGLRRLLGGGRKPAQGASAGAGATIIEGEYRVEEREPLVPPPGIADTAEAKRPPE